MAVAGSGTPAYKCWLTPNGSFSMGNSMMINDSMCVKPKVAMDILRSGKSAIVAGSDIVKLKKLLAVSK